METCDSLEENAQNPERKAGFSAISASPQRTLRFKILIFTNDGTLSRTAKENDVTVRIANLESAQAVMSILQGLAEYRAQPGKLGGQGIGVGSIDEGVPSYRRMSIRIRRRRNVLLRLQENLRASAADDREERILARLLKPGLEAKFVAIESDGPNDVTDDKKWRNMLYRSLRHGGTPVAES